jgi:hypothetical protein
VTSAELIEQFRIDSEDGVAPYLSADEYVLYWLNEAEEEAAIRARLLREVANPELCEIEVTAGINAYPLHAAVAWITRAVFIPEDGTEADDGICLDLVDEVEMDRLRPRWRTTSEHPRHLMVFDTSVQLGCLPASDGTLKLEVYRVPLDKIEERTSESPEIARHHHRFLVHWALHKAYNRPDSQVYDPQRSALELERFERQFGLRPDAKMRRDIEQNRPHMNKAWP